MARKPTHEIRHGLLRVRIYRRNTRDGIRHDVTLHRRFRNGDLWQGSQRFGRDDIPVVRYLLDQAHEWILVQKEPAGPSENDHCSSTSTV